MAMFNSFLYVYQRERPIFEGSFGRSPQDMANHMVDGTFRILIFFRVFLGRYHVLRRQSQQIPGLVVQGSQ